ncbi:transcription factor-like 5 protein [Salvelinus alpinus]|uniref:transcription factor-like 5 protein n=1 Tax=Salvelinus sp. IW2-2015 TaxID=2691554 RepID=UPI0038D4DC72
MSMSVACKTINVSPACKTIHVSPALGQYNPDSVEVIMSQNGCVPNDQSQILGTELNLMEMTEVEYTHLQHIIQSHMEAQAAGPEGSGDARFNTTVFTVENSAPQPTNCEAEYPAKSPPNTPPDAMSTSTDEQQYILGSLNQGGQVDIKEIKMVLVSDGNVIPGERTPTTCGEVPGSVLAKVRSAVDATQERGLEAYNNGSTQLLSRPNPPARVRLEKRFNCAPCDISRQQDVQSAALSNFLTMLHQSNEAQEAAMHPQPQKWVRSDRGNPIELSYPYGSMFNPIAGARQGYGNVPHMLDPNKHQGLIIPKNFTFSYRQDKMPDKVPCVNSPNPTEEKVWVKVEDDAVAKPAKRGRTRGTCAVKTSGVVTDSVEGRATGGAGAKKRGGPPVESSQRRERHNSKERDRRRRIRFCCDELNVLAPFCNHETDKATTLQWTTAFLKYVREVYGDSIKQEFQGTFCGKTGQRLKPSSASGQVMVRQETAEPSSTPQASEQ